MGAIKSVFKATPSASEAASLVTSGAGVFYGLGATSTATAGANAYMAAYDASAASTGLYDYHSGGSTTAATRLLWIQQIAGGASGPPVAHLPIRGIHFFKGLVVAQTNATGKAVGSSAWNAIVTYRHGFPSNPIND